MQLNILKIKEIIFHRPNVHHSLLQNPVAQVDTVNELKLLGVYFNSTRKFDEHVTSLLSTCNQHFYLLKQLKCQGISLSQLHVIFNALIVS